MVKVLMMVVVSRYGCGAGYVPLASVGCLGHGSQPACSLALRRLGLLGLGLLDLGNQRIDLVVGQVAHLLASLDDGNLDVLVGLDHLRSSRRRASA